MKEQPPFRGYKHVRDSDPGTSAPCVFFLFLFLRYVDVAYYERN